MGKRNVWIERFWQMLLWLVLGMCLGGGRPVAAQEFVPVDPEHQQQLLEEIARVSAGIETLECSFVQRKTMAVLAETAEAAGKMYYRKADRMRWEYLQPEAYYFVINAGKSLMKKGEVIDRGGSARIFGEISKMILTCISGQQLVDEQKFTPAYTQAGDIFKITLVPKNRRMLQMMSALVMEFDMREHAIRAVEMWQGEDVTRIEFKDKQVNGRLDEALFRV